jgi:hypothetical protein
MWSVRLSDDQRQAITTLLRELDAESDGDLKGVLEALDYARWDELPDAQLPWDRVSDLATAQGIDEADVVWDLAGGLPSKPKRVAASKRARPRTRV